MSRGLEPGERGWLQYAQTKSKNATQKLIDFTRFVKKIFSGQFSFFCVFLFHFLATSFSLSYLAFGWNKFLIGFFGRAGFKQVDILVRVSTMKLRWFVKEDIFTRKDISWVNSFRMNTKLKPKCQNRKNLESLRKVT